MSTGTFQHNRHMATHIQWAGLTDTGRQRDHNEDNYFIDEALGLAMVADGMGGHDSGEVASALAVQTVRQAVAAGMGLAEALKKAHKAIVSHPKGGGVRPMGTTGVVVHVTGSQAEVAWVGDSRAYLFNGDQLLPLTKDHTPVQQLVNAGKLSMEQARHHPSRNQILQALGSENRHYALRPETQKAYLEVGSVILLCSDGLTEHLSDEQIFQQLKAGTKHLEATVQRLVDEALDEGGSDNITVVLLKRVAG